MRKTQLGREPVAREQDPTLQWIIEALRKLERASYLKDQTSFAVAMGGGVRTISTAGSVTILEADYSLFCDATLGAITVPLPAAALAKGRIFNVKKIDASANFVRIDPDGAETIDDLASIDIVVQYAGLTVQSDGTEWFII